MIFRWISGFSLQAQLKCFCIELGNATTRLSISGVLACLNTTLLSYQHVSVAFGVCTGRAIVKASYHFRTASTIHLVAAFLKQADITFSSKGK